MVDCCPSGTRILLPIRFYLLYLNIYMYILKEEIYRQIYTSRYCLWWVYILVAWQFHEFLRKVNCRGLIFHFEEAVLLRWLLTFVRDKACPRKNCYFLLEISLKVFFFWKKFTQYVLKLSYIRYLPILTGQRLKRLVFYAPFAYDCLGRVFLEQYDDIFCLLFCPNIVDNLRLFTDLE